MRVSVAKLLAFREGFSGTSHRVTGPVRREHAGLAGSWKEGLC